MADKKENIGGVAARVRQIAEPLAGGLGLTLWDVRFVKEGASWFLRIFIDKDGVVTTEDCANMSHALDGPLDEADPISHGYYLEVQSPGLGRELTRRSHFEAMKGREVRVKFIQNHDFGRELRGKLTGFEKNIVTVTDLNGETHSFNKSETAFVKLDDDELL